LRPLTIIFNCLTSLEINGLTTCAPFTTVGYVVVLVVAGGNIVVVVVGDICAGRKAFGAFGATAGLVAGLLTLTSVVGVDFTVLIVTDVVLFIAVSELSFWLTAPANIGITGFIIDHSHKLKPMSSAHAPTCCAIVFAQSFCIISSCGLFLFSIILLILIRPQVGQDSSFSTLQQIHFRTALPHVLVIASYVYYTFTF
jgi:hypothetical protein